MRKIFSFFMALAMSAMMMAQSPEVTLDFTSNVWGLPEGSSAGLTAEATYSNGTYSVTMAAATKYYFNSTGKYLMLGKQNSYIKLPEFNFKVSKIAVTGTSGASEAVKQNIYVDDDAVSTETTGMKNVTQEYVINANYQTIGTIYQLVVTSAHNTQITKIEIYKEGTTPPARELQSIYIDGTATELEYFEGETFEPAGLKIMGVYDDELGDAEITKGITWSFEPEVFALENTSVVVTAKVGDFTSAEFTVNNIVVEEFVQTSANTYTSNVELSTEGGTSASAAKVVIQKDTFPAIKAGASKTAGACVVTIPDNTKTLHFHAAAWNGETVKLDVNGTEYSLVADAGVSGQSTTYSLSNDPETQDYFSFDPKGATTITFTATSGKRFVLFGVNAELEEGPGTNLITLPYEGKAGIGSAVKVMRNGRVYILREGKMFNLQGMIVK